jgi:hypothetical protein
MTLCLEFDQLVLWLLFHHGFAVRFAGFITQHEYAKPDL